MVSDELVKQRYPNQSLRQPLPDQQPPGFVFDLDVVLGLSPIVADEQHPLSSLMINTARAMERTCYDLMDQCSSGTTSHQYYRPPHHPPAHDLVIDLNKAWENRVLTGGRLGQQHARRSGCCSPIRENGLKPLG